MGIVRHEEVKHINKGVWESVKLYVLVVGGAASVGLAAKYSLNWYLEQFWGASADFWQYIWYYITLYFDNEKQIVIWGSYLLIAVVFWGFNLLMLIPDLTDQPKWITMYKIQNKDKTQINMAKLRKVILVNLFNEVLITLPCCYVYYYLSSIRWQGVNQTSAARMPSFMNVLFEICFFSMVEETMFYYGHRLLHIPLLYRKIHKVHHEWQAPIGLTCIYTHPVEHLACNVLPVLMGPLILGSHLSCAWLWITVAIVSTSISHCGYHLPGLPSPEAHDYHHAKFINNFGVLGVLDRLHGTDRQFMQSVHFQRHCLLTSTTPVNDLYPDYEKKKL